MRRVERFRSSRSAAINVVFALTVPLMIGAAGYAVDFGSVFLDRRELQGVADLAAVAAAADPARAQVLAQAVFAANRKGDSEVLVSAGAYAADPVLDPRQRFVAGATPADAVRVVARRPSPLFFARLFTAEDAVVEVHSTAAAAPRASFSVASRLLRLKGGILNGLLSKLVGAEIDLTLMDANALAAASIDLGSLSEALSASGAGPSGSGAALGREVEIGDFVSALGLAARRDGHLNAASILDGLARDLAGSRATLVPGAVAGLSPSGVEAVPFGRSLGLDVNVLDLLSAGLVNAAGSTRLDLDLNVAGLAGAKLQIVLGERDEATPMIAVGEPGASAETRQLRARLVLRLGGGALPAAVELPIEIVAASGRAELAAVDCSAGARSATLAVTPGVAEIEIGRLVGPIEDASMGTRLARATILDLALVKIRARARLSLADMRPTGVIFVEADLAAGTVRTVRTTAFVRSLTADLVRHMDLDVTVLGLPLGLPSADALASEVPARLLAVAEPVDDIVEAVLGLAGVGLGEASVRMNAVSCTQPEIVG